MAEPTLGCPGPGLLRPSARSGTSGRGSPRSAHSSCVSWCGTDRLVTIWQVPARRRSFQYDMPDQLLCLFSWKLLLGVVVEDGVFLRAKLDAPEACHDRLVLRSTMEGLLHHLFR